MRWRDIRFEKPTEADGDSDGKIVQMLDNGRVCTSAWHSLAFMVAWMPLSELPSFDPIPDPPEGWRFVQAGDAFDRRAKFWNKACDEWVPTMQGKSYDPDFAYIVPIDPPAPPEPQYRPFANAAEFEPHKELWFRRKEGNLCRVVSYSDCGASMGTCNRIWYWQELMDEWEFADGSPFGVKVE